LFCNAVLILFFGFFAGEEVTINMTVPENVTAGSDFEVQIMLNKSNLESFSRLLQEMPAGLTAVSNINSNASFDFKNKKITLIWIKLPKEDQVSVSYTVSVDARLKGTFTLGGKFSYIEDNERKTIEIPVKTITINPSPTIDPSLAIDINDFEKLTSPTFILPSGQGNVVCVRQRPVNPIDSSNGYVINILVNKEDKLEFAKIEEHIPAGFKAVSMDSKNGIFTFKDNVVKILWMSLPAEPHFVVSYKVVPEDITNNAKPELSGKFSYLDDDRTYTVNIIEKDVNVAELKGEALTQLINELASVNKPYESNEVFADNKKNHAENNMTQTAQNDNISNSNIHTKNSNNINPNTSKNSTRTNKNNNNEVLAQISKNNRPVNYGKSSQNKDFYQAFLLEPEEGIYYRVQIAAGHKPVDVIRYFRKYRIKGEIRSESHEGWYKYSVGSYRDYKEARDYRNNIWNLTIKDAFVSAYSSGKRITVQEALMVSNQKWVK